MSQTSNPIEPGSIAHRTITKRVIAALHNWHDVEDDQPGLTPETSFADLPLDSLDRIEMTMAIEGEFDLEISDEEGSAWKTVADVVTYVTERLEVAA